ncbi:hypothetical protein K438DRAFT_1831241 [Mycena galopus ATCC 62051]|nr:hypothetical protein K438DRAFT_1831241 [Mycena galopus ATCC 62051]
MLLPHLQLLQSVLHRPLLPPAFLLLPQPIFSLLAQPTLDVCDLDSLTSSQRCDLKLLLAGLFFGLDDVTELSKLRLLGWLSVGWSRGRLGGVGLGGIFARCGLLMLCVTGGLYCSGNHWSLVNWNVVIDWSLAGVIVTREIGGDRGSVVGVPQKRCVCEFRARGRAPTQWVRQRRRSRCHSPPPPPLLHQAGCPARGCPARGHAATARECRYQRPCRCVQGQWG